MILLRTYAIFLVRKLSVLLLSFPNGFLTAIICYYLVHLIFNVRRRPGFTSPLQVAVHLLWAMSNPNGLALQKYTFNDRENTLICVIHWHAHSDRPQLGRHDRWARFIKLHLCIYVEVYP